MAGVAAVILAAACHAAPSSGPSGDPPHSDGSAATNAGDGGAAPAAGGKLTQGQIAANDNAAGERLMAAGKYEEAAEKFKLAVLRTGDPTYIFRLCKALIHTERFEDALHACQNSRNDATPTQRSQADQMVKDIIAAAAAKGVTLCDGCIYEQPPDPPPH